MKSSRTHTVAAATLLDVTRASRSPRRARSALQAPRPPFSPISGGGPPLVIGLLWICAVLAFGCDRGGAGGGGAATLSLPPRPAYLAAGPPASPEEHGSALFGDMGCALCHGKAGKGGVANPNCNTGGLINGLVLVKEGYTDEQLQKKIAEGVPTVGKADPGGPVPPLRMPRHADFLQPSEIAALAAYLFSLYPKDRQLKDDWDDE